MRTLLLSVLLMTPAAAAADVVNAAAGGTRPSGEELVESYSVVFRSPATLATHHCLVNRR